MEPPRLNAREIKQGVDQPQQPQTVAMDHGQILGPQHLRRGGQRIADRSEHQGKGGSEFVAHVGEECGLGAVNLRESQRAFSLFLVGPGIDNAGGNLRRH